MMTDPKTNSAQLFSSPLISDANVLNQQLVNVNKQLRDSETRFAAFVKATSDVIYRMNADWTIMLELQGREFLEDTGEPIQHWMDKYIHSEDKEQILHVIQEAIRTKSIFQLEHQVKRLDGKMGWASSRAIPIVDRDGNIIEWFGTTSDITQRKQAEEALRRSKDELEQQKRLYEAVTASTPDLVYVFDLQYKFTYANKALLTMWGKNTLEEAKGKGLRELGYEEWHAEMHEREIDEVVATKRLIRGEVAFPHATLGRRIYDYIFSPVFDANNEIVAVAGTTRDITEMRQLSEQKDEFLAMASHELKTPVTVIKAYTQIFHRSAQEANDKQAAVLALKMEAQIDKLTSRIAELLDVSRIQGGKLHLQEKHFDFNELIDSVVEEIQRTTHRHQIIRRLTTSRTVFGDQDRIGQVVINLLTNAIKYSPQSDVIYVYTKLVNENQRDRIVFSVEDFGIGIPETDQKRIFERFYRVTGGNQNTYPGLGLGLYICSEVIKWHGGTIWLENKKEGGSIFSFSLLLKK
ncbi:PAS domain-containing sensor histidine kinase [Olivibacter jilunii]|uniref:PAS domain-containing sensor histidine kinase n=1 Tax=Olivibacter jilunii TaxID=985016 RepID=UPI003F5CF614